MKSTNSLHIPFGMIFLVIVMMLGSYRVGKREGYRQGQVDALNGKYKYQRLYIIQPNGDTTGVIYEYNERIESEDKIKN